MTTRRMITRPHVYSSYPSNTLHESATTDKESMNFMITSAASFMWQLSNSCWYYMHVSGHFINLNRQANKPSATCMVLSVASLVADVDCPTYIERVALWILAGFADRRFGKAATSPRSNADLYTLFSRVNASR